MFIYPASFNLSSLLDCVVGRVLVDNILILSSYFTHSERIDASSRICDNMMSLIVRSLHLGLDNFGHHTIGISQEDFMFNKLKVEDCWKIAPSGAHNPTYRLGESVLFIFINSF